MANAVTFGVGCFHFAPRRMLLEDFSRDVFVGDLRAGLETINSVKQVTIEGFEWFSAGGGGLCVERPNIQGGRDRRRAWPISACHKISNPVRDIHSDEIAKGVAGNS